MVLSSVVNDKISVSGNTLEVVMRHRFRHRCQRLRPRSHGQVKRGIADSLFTGYGKVCYRVQSCRSSDTEKPLMQYHKQATIDQNLKFTYKKWRPEGRHVNDGYAATIGRLSGKCKPLLRMALDADQFLHKYQIDPAGMSPGLINDLPAPERHCLRSDRAESRE